MITQITHPRHIHKVYTSLNIAYSNLNLNLNFLPCCHFSYLLPCCHFQVVNLRSAPPASQIQKLAKIMWFGGDIFICRSKTWTAMWFGGEINETKKDSQGNWGNGQAGHLKRNLFICSGDIASFRSWLYKPDLVRLTI